MEELRSVTVLGAGSWGTASADHLARAGYKVRLWGRDADQIRLINELGENRRYFPSIKLNQRVKGYTNLKSAVAGSELVVIAVPSHSVSSVLSELKSCLSGFEILLSLAKGLDAENLETISQLVSRVMGSIRFAVLSGPSFALEVLQNRPTAVTCASSVMEVAELASKYFHFNNFRVYTSSDILGVEYSGVLKNVIALAVGILDGLSIGLNARAALITRGLAEIQRFVVDLGGERATVVGLSGLGDLLLTSTGDLSRNRRVGVLLGQGLRLDDILQSIGQVAEGVRNSRIVMDIAQQRGIQMPIVEEVNNVISGKHRAVESVQVLLARTKKRE